MPLRIGYCGSHEQWPAPRLVEFAVAAERAGFDAAWVSDHFHPWQDNQGHAGHPWITLAAAAQHTSRLTLGTGVTCPPTATGRPKWRRPSPRWPPSPPAASSSAWAPARR